MKELLLSRNNKNLCPICNKPLDNRYIMLLYKGTKLKVCKVHVKYIREEKKNDL